VSQISRQWDKKMVRLSALRTGPLYTPGNIPGEWFGVFNEQLNLDK